MIKSTFINLPHLSFHVCSPLIAGDGLVSKQPAQTVIGLPFNFHVLFLSLPPLTACQLANC